MSKKSENSKKRLRAPEFLIYETQVVLGFVLSQILILPFESWQQEIELKGLDADVWYSQDCPQFIYRLPARDGQSGEGVILHATSHDPKLRAAHVHWEALKQVSKGAHEVFFVVTCGGAATATFVHSLLHSLEGFEPELTTADKVMMARLRARFPGLSRARMVWNEGPWWDSLTASPWILGAVGTAQRGLWTGEIRFRILERQETGLSQWAQQNALMMELEDQIEALRRLSPWSLRALHFEHEALVKALSATRSRWDQFLDYFFERRFFFDRGWEWMLKNNWELTEISDFDQQGEAVLRLETFFLGARQLEEIERELKSVLTARFRGRLGIEVRTTHFSPFLRTLFESEDAQTVRQHLKRVPNLVAIPVILEQVTESRFFREAGFATFDFTPLKAQVPFFQEVPFSQIAADEDHFAKAVKFEVDLLRDLLD